MVSIDIFSIFKGMIEYVNTKSIFNKESRVWRIPDISPPLNITMKQWIIIETGYPF